MGYSFLAPIGGIITYLMYPTELRISNYLLKCITIIHNSTLILCNGYIFLNLLNVINKNGIVFKQNYYFEIEPVNKLIYYAYVTKYIDFIDTFLLYLSGKKPIFLQKFHHIGAVICWYLAYINKCEYIVLSTFLNCFIHTIMYFYYLCTILKIRYVSSLKKYLTTLQLFQLIIPYIIINVKYFPIETTKNRIMLMICNCYVLMVILLFLQFYYRNYLIKFKD